MVQFEGPPGEQDADPLNVMDCRTGSAAAARRILGDLGVVPGPKNQEVGIDGRRGQQRSRLAAIVGGEVEGRGRGRRRRALTSSAPRRAAKSHSFVEPVRVLGVEEPLGRRRAAQPRPSPARARRRARVAPPGARRRPRGTRRRSRPRPRGRSRAAARRARRGRRRACLADEPLDDLARASLRPVRLLGQEQLHLVDVDPGGIIVELEAVLGAGAPSDRILYASGSMHP